MKEKLIPTPTEELKAARNADNQFGNFERVFRSVMSVPKAEVLKREAKEKHRNERKRARKIKDKGYETVSFPKRLLRDPLESEFPVVRIEDALLCDDSDCLGQESNDPVPHRHVILSGTGPDAGPRCYRWEAN